MDLQKSIAIDLDGCLTDGRQYITSEGTKLFKAFHSRDVAAIRELIFNGWQVLIVSADDDPSGFHFAQKVGAEFICLRDKSQITAKVAVGDSAWDIPMLEKAHRAYCPMDSTPEVMNVPGIKVINKKGGEGIMNYILSDLKTIGWI